MSGGSIRNNVDIQIRRDFCQLFCQGRLAPDMPPPDIAAPKDNFCNIVEARKFRDLIGNIVTVYRFDGGSKLLGQTHMFFQTVLIFFGHGRMIRRLDIECSQCAMKSLGHAGTRLHDP